MRALATFLGSLQQAGLAGGCVALALFATDGSGRIGRFVLGWCYGMAVVGLLRLFRVAPAAYPLVGLVVGPVPAALAVWMLGGASKAEWEGMWLLSAGFGALLGALEWGRTRRSQSPRRRAEA